MRGGVTPFTGFGRAANSSIKFGILRARDGSLPDWSGGPRLVYLAIQNSDRTVRQRLGREPWRVTFRIGLASVSDLEALDGMQGERETLWYRWGLTSRVGGSHERIVDVDYLRLDGTRLVEVAERRLPIGGGAECTATFERDYAAPAERAFGPYPPAPNPEA